jgi:hypothetical protein
MKTKIFSCLLALMSLFMGGANPAFAQGTAFTYQGRLDNNNTPANGTYDLSFSAFDADTNGNLIAGPVTNTAVAVSNGLFTVTMDFGAGVFDGSQRWLEIAVSTNGADAFDTVSPRQEITPAPYAIRAQTAGMADTAADVSAGSVVKSLNLLKDDVTLQAGANITITPNGNSLTIDAATGGGSSIWSLLNNNAYYNSGNVGIGTSVPHHRLGLSGGPLWTANSWTGSLELDNASAIGWRANAGGQHFGIGQSTGGLYFFRTASDPATTGSPSLYTMEISDAGHVLVAGPSSDRAGIPLQVNGNALFTTGGSGGEVQFGTPNGETGMTVIGANRADFRFNGSALKLLAGTGVGAVPAENGITINTSGNVGVGNTAPGDRLVVGGNLLADTKVEVNAGGDTYAALRLKNTAGSWLWQVTPSADSPGGRLRLTDESTGHEWVSITHSGNFSVATLTIRGGADVAEPFKLSRSDIAKGSVVVIDEDSPGQLKLSDQPYDTRVAGIVSGANGINPGIALHQEGVNDGGQNVALSGRVYVQADASFGAIKPGDLLTTSSTPGHAMKVIDHAKSQGAILGKAMTSLKEGKGMVLVLVTLQ